MSDRTLHSVFRDNQRARRVGVAAALFLVLAMIPVDRALAQRSLLAREGSSAIDAQINSGSYTIPSAFWGMHINNLFTPWPVSYFTNQRMAGSDIFWWNVEVAPGQYDFFWFDQWMAQAQAHGVTVMYTFAGIPQWYSSVPNDTNCAYEDGACDPPKDLNEDGSGTDAAFKNYVTAVVNHAGSQIQYWEIWNEPNEHKQWTPTCITLKNCSGNLKYAQLLRMASDARAIILAAYPNALILSPASVGWPGSATGWMEGWLNAGGGQYADVIAFHGYLNQWVMGHFPVAENEAKLIGQMKYVVKKYGQQTKPLWITEGGWGNVLLDGYSDAVLQSAFLARYILIQQSRGIARGYWYQWDSPFGAGTLFQGPAAPNIRMAGYAYNSIVNWTNGATISVPCTLQKGTSVWTCRYTRSTPAGYKALVVWNAKQNSTFTLSQGYAQYCDLKGNVTALQGKKVQIGMWPILLENENLGATACKP